MKDRFSEFVKENNNYINRMISIAKRNNETWRIEKLEKCLLNEKTKEIKKMISLIGVDETISEISSFGDIELENYKNLEQYLQRRNYQIIIKNNFDNNIKIYESKDEVEYLKLRIIEFLNTILDRTFTKDVQVVNFDYWKAILDWYIYEKRWSSNFKIVSLKQSGKNSGELFLTMNNLYSHRGSYDIRLDFVIKYDVTINSRRFKIAKSYFLTEEGTIGILD